MRVYLGRWNLVEIQTLVGERGLTAVRKMSHDAASQLRSNMAQLKGLADLTGGVASGASWTRTTTAGWQVESLTFPMWFYDYGATAVVDFYSRQYPEATVVLVFMYTTVPRSQKAEIQEVVHTFRIRKK